jgi:hypothetical protein
MEVSVWTPENQEFERALDDYCCWGKLEGDPVWAAELETEGWRCLFVGLVNSAGKKAIHLLVNTTIGAVAMMPVRSSYFGSADFCLAVNRWTAGPADGGSLEYEKAVKPCLN